MESLDGYLERLASSDATPGGGSAAALTGAVAAALVAMVGRKLEQTKPTQHLVARADALRRRLREAQLRDEQAYGAVVAAQGLSKSTDAQKALRRRALDTALLRAARAPLHAAALCLNVLTLCHRLSQLPMRALASDVGCAAELAHAALAACAYNVRINHRYLRESAAVRAQVIRLTRIEGEASRTLAHVRRAIAESGKRK